MLSVQDLRVQFHDRDAPDEAVHGLRFDMADNDQPDGPWTAGDRYSVFYGAEMGFFELETLGATPIIGGRLGVATLLSETWALRGDPERLLAYARERLASAPG